MPAGKVTGGAPKDVFSKPGNEVCADCGARRPNWASVSLGILICESCSGIHRKLGTHLSTVKGAKGLDTWKPEWVVIARKIGNAKSNEYYEHSVPPGAKYQANVALSGGDKLDWKEGKKLETWIRDKYEHKKYAKPGEVEPSKRLDELEEGPAAPPAPTAPTPTGSAAAATPAPTESTPARSSRSGRSKGARSTPGEIAASPAAGHMAEAFASLGEWVSDTGHTEHKEQMERKEHKEHKEHKHHHHRDRKESKEPKEHKERKERKEGKEGREGRRRDHSRRKDTNGSLDSWGQGPGATGPFADYMAPTTPREVGLTLREGHGSPLQFSFGPTNGLQLQHDQQQQPQHQQQHDQQQQHRGLPNGACMQRGCGASPLPNGGCQDYAGDGDPYARWAGGGGCACASAAPAPAYGGAHTYGEYEQMQAGYAGSAPELGQPQQRGGVGAGFRGGPDAARAAAERKVALVSVSRLFRDPTAFGLPRNLGLVMPYGLKLDAAEFEPNALKKVRDPAEKDRSRILTFASNASQQGHAAFNSAPAAASGASAFGAAPDAGCAAAALGFAQPGWAASAEGEAWHQGAAEDASRAIPPVVQAEVEGLRTEMRRLGEEMSTLRRERDEMAAAMSQGGFASAPSPAVPGGSAHLPALGQPMETLPPLAPGDSDAAPVSPAEQPGDDGSAAFAMDRDAFARYAHMFGQIPRDPDGLAGGREVREALDQSGLPPEDLFFIWRMSDWSERGALSLAEFACAAHLVAKLLDGLALPRMVPASMVNISLELSAEWAAATGLHCGAVAALPNQMLGPSNAPGPTPLQEESPQLPDGAAPTSWEVRPEAVEEYAGIFSALDTATGGTGSLRPDDAASVLASTRISQADAQQIWHMSDVDRDGRLNMGEFICAMHMASQRADGAPLPAALPPELQALATKASLAPVLPPKLDGAVSSTQPVPMQDGPSHWSVVPEELSKYRSLFDAADRGRCGFLGTVEAWEVLQRSSLPPEELQVIWLLADADGDGKLTFPEFVFAMHLASRRRLGVALPPELPKELVAVASGAAMQAVLMMGSMHPDGAALMTAPPAGSPWAVTAEQMEKYRGIWNVVVPPGSSVLGASESKTVLDRSELPVDDLSHIWNLSDRDGDGGLSFLEFVCAMHLANRRRQGLELPAALPPELAAVAEGGAVAEDAPVAAAVPTSPWVVEPEHMQKYLVSFEAWNRKDPNVVTADEARELFERSTLPTTELSHVWSLCDMNRDGRLNMPQFACAMHLVCRRRQGYELPPELPQELRQSVARLMEQLGPDAATARSSWALAPEQVHRYRIIWEATGKSEPNFLSADEARLLLERSHVPSIEVGHVLRHCDMDLDGRLSFPEFVCAMHLVYQRQQGHEMPTELPRELVQSAAHLTEH